MRRSKKNVSPGTLTCLDDIARHRMTFAEVLQRRHFPRLHLSGVVSWLQRRVENGHLQAHKLYGKRTYYSITHKTVHILTSAGCPVSRGATRPLGPTAKRHWLAFALFCNPSAGTPKTLYRPCFDQERFPILADQVAKGRPDPHRRRTFFQDGKVIGFFDVNRGQADFVSKKVRPKIFALLTRTKNPEMRASVDAGRFRLVVAAATESRAEELRQELQPAPPQPQPPFPCEIVVLDELRHLLPQSVSSTSLF